MLRPDPVDDALVGVEPLALLDVVGVGVGVPGEDVGEELERRVPGHDLLHYELAFLLLQMENGTLSTVLELPEAWVFLCYKTFKYVIMHEERDIWEIWWPRPYFYTVSPFIPCLHL